MAYRIEQEGYEFRGVNLGQKCVYDRETIIIGFDENDDNAFIMVKTEDDYSSVARNSSSATIILEGHERSMFDWVNIDDIELINCTVDEENPPQSISPIHVADILEDSLEMGWYDESDSIREIIRKCIESLRL